MNCDGIRGLLESIPPLYNKSYGRYNDLNSTYLAEREDLLFGTCEILQTVGSLYSVIAPCTMTEALKTGALSIVRFTFLLPH